MTQFAPSIPTKRLSAAILSTDMAFSLNNYLAWDANTLVAADFPAVGRGVFRSTANNQIEFFTFDPSTIGGPITILTRGNDYRGGTTDGVKPKYNWPANSTLVELGSNPPAEAEDYVDKTSDEGISGVKTFNSPPVVPTPANSTDAVNKSYADNLAQGGGADSSPTVKGIGRLSTSPNVTKGTATVTIASPAIFTLNSHGLTANDTIQLTTTGALPTGLSASTTYYVISTGLTTNNFEVSATLGGNAINTSGTQSGTHTLIKTTPIFVSTIDPQFVNYYVETGSANAYIITPSPSIGVYTVGQRFSFKATNANTTTSTLNINALGAKTIVRADGITALVANDILAGQIVYVEYDGTNFVMISGSGNLPVSISSIVYKEFGDGNDGTIVFDGSTTILGLVPSASVYTLTRDIYPLNMTVNSGVTIITAGYRIYVNTALSNNGTIKYDGNNGGTGGSGASGGASGGAAGSALSAGSILGGTAGQSGGTGSPSGGTAAGAGGNGGSVSESIGVAGVAGVAGNSGTNSGGAGGSAGSVTASQFIHLFQNIFNMYRNSGTSLVQVTGSAGSGGGGGGGGNGTNGDYGGGGGGSGSSGGIVFISAKSIVNSATGIISSKGGNGGTGGAGVHSVGTGGLGGAGGSGGSGGAIVLIYHSYSNSGSVTVAGGSGGTGGANAGTAGNGPSGNAGNSGVILQFAI